ncbi:MAG: Redoxin domain protein [Marmoricola sp.]|nr:Redoxin domain protein [Marmoricola sp.]
MKGHRAALAALLLAGSLAACSASGSPHGAGSSSTLPNVTLAGLGGDPAVDLATLKGPAVVNLWASWCGPCKSELPIYGDFARAYAGKVKVLGVDFQETSASGAIDLLKQSRADYPIVTDPDGRTRAIGLPKLILVDAAGRIVFQEYVEIRSAGQLQKLVADHLGIAG